MLLTKFLGAILPGEGVKCWTSIKDKKARNHFCATIEELAIQIEENDALGIDTYHACATYKTAQNRRAPNAEFMRCFWTDIDIGVSTPERPKYATMEDAIRACDEFCAGLALPIPGFVASGTGLHAYWVLDRTITAAEWLPLAQLLKLHMQAKGFHADPSRTADAASILRPPGTKNYKVPEQPRAVAVIDAELFEPVSYEEFSSALVNAPYVAPAPIINASSINAALSAGLPTSKAFDTGKGAAAGARGSTQLRYAGELVAKGYPFDDVLARCMEWNKLCTPPQEEAEVLRITKSAFNMHAHKHPAAIATVAPAPMIPVIVATPEVMAEVLPQAPWGFRWGNANQLLASVEKKDDGGKVTQEWKAVTQLPAYMMAWLNEEGHAQKNAYLFRLYHPQKGWHTFCMSAKDFNGDKWYAEWVENGGSIVDGMDKLFKTYVRRAENMLRMSGVEKMQYSQFGWKDTPAGPNTAFLAGSKLCHADGRVEDAVGTDKLAPLMQAMQPGRGGSLEGWSLAANKLGMPGLEAHLLMVVSSFAATLMKFAVDEGNGGSILSIVSEESGQGKTPMAGAMASVWGTMPAIISTGNFTGNRLIDDVVRRCNLPQVQEEMPYSDPAIAAEGVKKFTSGSDRGRLDQGGNSKGLAERYQTLLVSISNKSLYELVKLADIPMSCRIFEIEVERPDKELIANLGGISREMLYHCGYAGVAFARMVVEPQVNQYIREHLTGQNMGKVGSAILKYRELLASRPEHRFIVWPLACIEVAAQILNHYKIMEFDINRLMSWATQQAKLYTKTSDLDLASMKLDAFISEHTNTCVTVQGPYNPRLGPALVMRGPTGSKLYMRMEIKTNRLYIATEPMKEWCVRNGISFIGLGKKLRAESVVLNTSKPVTLGAGTEIVSSRTLCWEIDTAHPSVSSQTKEELVIDTSEKVVPIKA